MSYKEIKLYQEIKNEMRTVIESEENGRAWMKLAREQLVDVKALITAAKKLNKGVQIIPQQLIDEVRADIAAEKEAAEIENETEETPDSPTEETEQ